MHCYRSLTSGCRLVAVLSLILLTPLSASAGAERPQQPALSFFEGRTEMVSVVKVVMKKPYRSRTSGSGRIMPDGSLALVQSIHDEGKAPHSRFWRMKQVAAGRFAGTMSDAVGPVTAQEIAGKYRFSFKLKGNLAVEQWLTPLPGGKAARSKIVVRKLGMRVATSEGTIQRI
jgi:hypothetical protein